MRALAASPEPMNVEEAQLGYNFTLNDHKIATLVIGD
jgi:hypothetical protein